MNRLGNQKPQTSNNTFFPRNMSCCRNPTATIAQAIPDKFQLPMRIIQSCSSGQAPDKSKITQSIDELTYILLEMSDGETNEFSYYAANHPVFCEAIKTQQAVKFFSREQQGQTAPKKTRNIFDKSELEVIIDHLSTNLCLKTALKLTRKHSLETLRTTGWLDITSYIARLILEPLSEVKPLIEILKTIEEESSEESKDKLKMELSNIAIVKENIEECKEIIEHIHNPLIKDLALHSAFTECLCKSKIPQALEFLCRMNQIPNLDEDMKNIRGAIENRK
ncbi:MAG: hypothetical protein FJZ57_07165 [Chlamydiae bacterium]|nr:hypothetical protein [Chlamydiota bacterium]